MMYVEKMLNIIKLEGSVSEDEGEIVIYLTNSYEEKIYTVTLPQTNSYMVYESFVTESGILIY